VLAHGLAHFLDNLLLGGGQPAVAVADLLGERRFGQGEEADVGLAQGKNEMACVELSEFSTVGLGPRDTAAASAAPFPAHVAFSIRMAVLLDTFRV
jgi:hypothetical protein